MTRNLLDRLPRPRLPATLTELLKHSAVYGVGNLLRRSISILMLPIYTRYLSPADYGHLALLDLFSSAFARGRNGRSDDHFNLLSMQERARFRKSMPGETAMTAATRLYANGR